jgi:PIN domain nuclease of toxin-antitoxin system
MKLLLDTHILLWSAIEPERLSPSARSALQDPGNQLWLSPISVWEILILADKGRVQIDAADPVAWIRKVLAGLPLREAPLNVEVALESRTVDVEHADPADRFLVATAIVHDLTLFTADRRLLKSARVRTMAN